MSGQTNDTFLYNNKSYSISAVEKPKQFFVIQDLGINPEADGTACWRGYVAKFSLHHSSLVLVDLNTNNGNVKCIPIAINGIMPTVEKPNGLSFDYREWRYWYYRNIDLVISYSGDILITDDFIRGRYIHMGFQSPLSYRKVIELGFDRGKLVRERDLSEIVARLREAQHTVSEAEQICRLPSWIQKYLNIKI